MRPTDRRNLARRRGFTLIEIMVAAAIIVLLIGMALPVFRLITGGRSEEGATNAVAAMLARARADAVGLQRPAGVAFVYNPGNRNTYMAEVQFRDAQPWSAIPGGYNTGQYARVNAQPVVGPGYPYIDFYYECVQDGNTTKPTGTGLSGGWQFVSGPPLDIVPDTDLVPLPSGIAAQTVCNCSLANGVRTSDGYLSVGAILFDGRGHVTAQPYEMDGIRTDSLLYKAGLGGQAYPVPNTSLNQNIYTPYDPARNGTSVPGRFGVQSQYGLVLFQRDAFLNQGFPIGQDPLYTTPTQNTPPPSYTAPSTAGQSQQSAEQWLDLNATPLLIDRYNGSIIRGQ